MKIERNESIFLEILFLRTLYANKKAVWWTSVIQILATLVIYVKTDHPIYAAFALAFFLIVLGRTANASAFERKDLSSATMADLRTWEWRYLLGAISTCILLGLLCLVSIYVLADPSAAITSVAIVVASMVALVTRNYVSPTVVIGMSIGILAPLFLTFVLLGGIYNWLLALLILPYFWSNIQAAAIALGCTAGQTAIERRCQPLRRRAERHAARVADVRPQPDNHRRQYEGGEKDGL